MRTGLDTAPTAVFDVSAQAGLARTYDRLATGMVWFVLLATLAVGAAAAYAASGGQPVLVRIAGPLAFFVVGVLAYEGFRRLMPSTGRARRIEVSERAIQVEYTDGRTRIWRWFDLGSEMRVQDFAVAQDGMRRWSDIHSHLFQVELREGKQSSVVMISWEAARALLETARRLSLPESETRESSGEGGGWFIQNRFGRGVSPHRLEPSPRLLWR